MVWELALLISYETEITCRLESPDGRVGRRHRTMNDEFLKYAFQNQRETKSWTGIITSDLGFVEIKREDGSITRITFILQRDLHLQKRE
jgi:hypothetical protein